jgi:ADP-heptose:LPS heptosyltransferase
MWGRKITPDIRDPRLILVVLPDGLGDLICWMPVIRFVAERYPSVRILFPIDSSGVRPILVRALPQETLLEFVGSDARQNLDLALILSDNEKLLSAYKQSILSAPTRIGLAGGKNRSSLLTHSVQRSIWGGCHEVLRNQRVISFLGGDAKASLGDVLVEMTIPHQSSDLSYLWQKPYVVLQLFSRGHGREWPLEQFYKLAMGLIKSRFGVVLTGTQDEAEKIGSFYQKCGCPSSMFDVSGKTDLESLIGILHGAECVVSASTGPLHLASALGVKAIGLYPPKKGLNPLRWGPVGLRACAVSMTSCSSKKCTNKDCKCMAGIDADHLLDLILNREAHLKDVGQLKVWSAA